MSERLENALNDNVFAVPVIAGLICLNKSGYPKCEQKAYDDGVTDGVNIVLSYLKSQCDDGVDLSSLLNVRIPARSMSLKEYEVSLGQSSSAP